jgi:peroxiredoxin
MKKLATILGAATLVFAFASLAAAGELKPGDMAPEFTLSNQHGKEISLKDFEGKLVVLEWVNPDCPFVQRHYKAKTMSTLASKWAEKEVVWLAVNSTKYMGVEENLKFATAEGLDYSVLADQSGEIGHAYHAKTTPHMFVISGEGKILYNGAIDDDKRGDLESPTNYVDAAIAGHLDGGSIEQTQTVPYGCSVKYAKKGDMKAKATSR